MSGATTDMGTGDWLLALLLGVTPMAVVAVVALLRGYHVHLRLWRPKQSEGDDEPGDDR